MTIVEAIKQIEQHRLSNETYMECVSCFKREIKEENFVFIIRLIGYFDKYFSYEGINELLLVLELYKEKLSSNDNNNGLYNYGKSLIYYYANDRSRCIEFALEAKKYFLNNSNYLYYLECLLISALYQDELYTEALNENVFVEETIYNDLRKDQKLVVLLNFILIYIYLKDFEESDSYSHKLVQFIAENQNLEFNINCLITYINIFKTLSFGEEHYNNLIIESTINNYVKCAFKEFDDDISYSYLDIHISILKCLYKMNRIKEVYEVCNSYLLSLNSDYIDCDMAKLLTLSINKNNVTEYNNALEKYNKALEFKAQINHDYTQYYYHKEQKYNDINMQYEKLKTKYSHDALTKCFSRAKYDEIKKERKFGSLIYFDVNNLKLVNDTFGHKFGDKYLVKFVSNVKCAMPDDDLYRIGGDEFILVSNDVEPEIIIHKLENLSKMKLYNTKRIEKFSAGIVINKNNLSIYAAEEKADKVLYDVKNIKEEFYRFYK